MSSKKYYSSHRNPDLINQATLRLLEININHLLADIYDESNQAGIFGHPEVRIGLTLKLLHNLRVNFDKSTLRPIIRDIESLMNDQEYLEETGNPERRLKCLRDELDFIQRYIDIDDTITLNTIESPKHRQKNTSPTSTNTRSNSSNPYRSSNRNDPATSGCIIQ